MNREFVEAEGTVHLVSTTGEYTLCGDAFDLGSDIEGYEWSATKKRTVTCPHCKDIIDLCRGVRTAAAE
jgi:hypothetical protein